MVFFYTKNQHVAHQLGYARFCRTRIQGKRAANIDSESGIGWSAAGVENLLKTVSPVVLHSTMLYWFIISNTVKIKTSNRVVLWMLSTEKQLRATTFTHLMSAIKMCSFLNLHRILIVHRSSAFNTNNIQTAL